MEESKGGGGDEGVSLKVLAITFSITLFILIGIGLSFNNKPWLISPFKYNFSENIHGAVVVNPWNGDINPLGNIGIKNIVSCRELDLKKEGILLLNDFENSDTCQMESFEKRIDRYNGICGNYLRIDYNSSSCPASDIEIKCTKKIELKNYEYINFLFRATNPNIGIQGGFFDKNDMVYSKTYVYVPTAKGEWVLVTIPLNELYDASLSKKKILNGDVFGYFFRFKFVKECAHKEKVYIGYADLDTIYLSK